MDGRLNGLWTSLAIPSTQIHQETLSNRPWEGEPWETKVLDVRLPKGVSLDKASRGLEGLLPDDLHEVQIAWVVEGTGLRAADLWVEGRLTHSVFFHETPEEPKPPAPSPAPSGGPQIALIVDDLGNLYAPFLSLLELQAPLTLAVFPHLSHSQQIAREASARGLEVIVHLPMEPRGYPEKRPGAGALTVSMGQADLERVLLEDLRDFPQAKGVNNHMGSRFTEDRDRMGKVMEVLAPKGLYFVDSLTTPRSAGYQVAMGMGIQAFRRDVFLDVAQNEEKIRNQFDKLLKVARLQGYAIGICHPYAETLQVLPELYRRSREQGYQWVTVSHLRIPGAESGRGLVSQRPRGH